MSTKKLLRNSKTSQLPNLIYIVCFFYVCFYSFLDYFPSPTRILHEIQMQVLEKQRLKQKSKDIEAGKILLIDQVEAITIEKQTKVSGFGTT